EARALSGAEMLNAIVLCVDIGARLVEACGGRGALLEKLHTSAGLFFGFSAAIGVGRLIGLSAYKLRHALALATIQVGLPCAFLDERNHLSKAFQYGQAGYAGTSSALLAEIGMEGNDAIVEGRHGILDTWGAEPNPEAVVAGLGTEYSILGMNMKFYSAGYP